ncbi:hypothetical protein GIB67_012797 [Kingdonia uniflora]|uniref:Multiple myeloma tumor-associated protein 2-like N-terminal domain-containing protein n=1 Tax=Kingdonia uniflora TaxID=39325 RepID=A0A7J7NFX5_9MAGN|nr:hypothetical protein GIB67_012797 [Kingdonia uniflora]
MLFLPQINSFIFSSLICKDLNWYAKDKKSQLADMEDARTEIQRIKEEEEQAMQEALGLAPKRASRPQGNRLDKYEYSELVKRESTAEDVGGGHAEAARLQGLGFARAPNSSYEEPTSLPPSGSEVLPEKLNATLPKPPLPPPPRNTEEGSSDDENSRKKRKREERKHEKRHSRDSDDKKNYEKRDKHHSKDSDDKKKHRKNKERRRHDSD